MSKYREYTIIVKEKSQFSIKDYDNILKYKKSEHNAKLGYRSALNTQAPSFPARSVTSSFFSSLDRMGNYALLDSETASILANSNIEALVPIPTQEEVDINVEGSGSFGFGEFYTGSRFYPVKSLNEKINANFRFQTHGTSKPFTGWPANFGFGAPGGLLAEEKKHELGNWNLWWHSQPREYMINNGTSGSYTQIYGGETWMTMSGDYSNENPFNAVQFLMNGDPSLEHTTSVNYTLDGTDVDVIIYEGNRFLYPVEPGSGPIPSPWLAFPNPNTAIDFNHPDFYGMDGNTRIQFIDWREYGDTKNPLYYYPSDYHISPNQGLSMGLSHHKQMVASSAAGLYNGFAKGANIYFFPGNFNLNAMNDLNVIKNFHTSKPINPKTGKRNPTVVNSSLTNYKQHPLHLYELGNKSSSSFSITGSDFRDLKGFRIEHFGKDHIFISSSTLLDDNTPTINEHGGLKTRAKTRQCATLHYFSGSNPSEASSSLQNKLDLINHDFTSSIDILSDGLKIHITSSTEYVVIRPKIYTGSIDNFISSASGYENTTNPKGGGFMTQLTGGYDPNTHITKIVVKGNQVATGSSLWPNAMHGYERLAPYDHYGIDRGFNHLYHVVNGVPYYGLAELNTILNLIKTKRSEVYSQYTSS